MQGEYEKWLLNYLLTHHEADKNLEEKEDFMEKTSIDSFGIIELIEEIESNFGIAFKNEHLSEENFSSVESLARVISLIKEERENV